MISKLKFPYLYFNLSPGTSLFTAVLVFQALQRCKIYGHFSKPVASKPGLNVDDEELKDGYC